MTVLTSYRGRAAPPLPDPDSLPFPGNLVRRCSDCSLSAGCKAPVPAEGIAPHEVMLIGQNPGCFPAGTLVSTPGGVRRIEDLLVGDAVLNGFGKAQKVSAVFSRETDALVNVKVHKMDAVRMTPNHPVLVVTATPCYNNHARRYCFPCSQHSCGRRYYRDYAYIWKAAGELTRTDFVVIPKLSTEQCNPNRKPLIPFPQRDEFHLTKYKNSTERHWSVRRGFHLNKKMAYVLGWYMAEGSSDVRSGTVQFALGANDSAYFSCLQEYCTSLFGFEGTWLREKHNCKVYSLHSRPLAAWFISLFGHGARNKRVPEPLFRCGPVRIRSFITGWYQGDGRHKESCRNDGIVTASQLAAYGLRDLLLRIGVVPTLHQEHWNGFAGDTSFSSSGYAVEFPSTFKWRRVTQSVTPFEDARLLHVDQVQVEPVHTRVYNVETEDNKYLVPFIVHNSQETEWGYKPFVGQAGRYLDSLLFQCGIPRESVAITNIVHCQTPNNRELRPEEIRACSKWLDIEVGVVQPRIIVSLGRPAVSRFLGADAGTMEHLHGKPVEKDGTIILPCYHPAAALRDTSLLRQCQEDFQVLRGLVKGTDWREYHVRDEFPDPDYRVADNQVALGKMRYEIERSGEFAVDTEVCRGKLWSVQISTQPGRAWFIPIAPNYQGRVDLSGYSSLCILHNYLYDINYLNVAEGRFADTMVMAYLLQREQGLKELASRLCGISMQTYAEVVRPGQERLSLDYLRKASKVDWPDPPTIKETKWSNRKGELITRYKKPWHISRKVSKLLGDFESDPSTDLWERWRGIPAEERSVVESVLGPMPESSLADIPSEQAIQYACRDASATLRVYHKLRALAEQMGLEFVLKMDLDILPMVHAMMQNGMAVDLDHYRKLSEDYDVRMKVKAAELAGVVGHSFNPASSPQVAAVVYKELGFAPTRRTASGDISTDDAELKKTKHPVAKGIIQYRGLLKLKSTYADNMIRSAHPDEEGVPRMHTVIKTTRVETGRLSSSKNDEGEGANLQNIPTRNKEAKAIKNGFVAPEGKKLVEADYAQIEIVTQAHLANCKGLIELFLSGKDPHTTTASRLFGVPYEEAKKDKYRYPCKRAGFGIIYMIGPRGLSTQINEYIADLEMDGEPIDIEPWDEATCEKFIVEYYRLYPEIKDYQMEQVAHARRYGYARDLFGRIRYLPEVSCPIRAIQEAGARQAANFPVTACLPADTHVTTRNGWLPIGEFIDGTEVWTGEKWARAKRLSMGSYPRVRLSLSDGRTFDCDTNHKLLVRTGPWPEWKSVMDIKEDEPLAQDWLSVHSWGKPIGDTEDWYWAGRFIGDGWLSSPTAKIRFWGMSFGRKEVQDGDRLMRWLSTKAINGHTNSKTGYYPSYDRRGNFKIGGGTQAGYALWLSLGMQQKKAREKRIPGIVFSLDYERRLAFLTGYTDADGRSSRRGWQLCSASRGLIEDTVRLASTVGFSAWIRDPQTRTCDWLSRVGRGSIVTSTLWYCDILKNRRELFIKQTSIMPSEPMYTLSVDDDRHAFASEGLISKNSAQGIIKRAMGELWQRLPRTEWAGGVKFLMQIHDSLVVEVTDREEVVEPYCRWMRGVMTGVVQLRVPVKVDFKVGAKWGELAKLDLSADGGKGQQ